MNKRILELATESGLYVSLTEGIPYPASLTAEECCDAYEKFSGLIIQECVQVCDRPLSKNMLPSNHIREHFGVK